MSLASRSATAAVVAALLAFAAPGCRVEPAPAASTAASEPADGAGAGAGAARFRLFVLGRAQDGGLPHLGCEAPCCAAARASGRVEYPACLGVHDTATGAMLMIEATPWIEAQVALLHRLGGVTGRGRRPLDALLLTHAHIGHYLGLAFVGREVAAVERLPVHVSPRMASFLRGNGPWSQLCELDQIELREVEPGEVFEPIPGLRVLALPVPHRDEFSDTMAFRIEGPSKTVLFVPDVDRWDRHSGLLERLLDGVDVAYLDGTFYDGRELPGRDRNEIPHPPMTDTMARLAAAARARPGRLRFIHLNHSNPAWNDPAIERELEGMGFRIAQQGEVVDL